MYFITNEAMDSCLNYDGVMFWDFAYAWLFPTKEEALAVLAECEDKTGLIVKKMEA